MKKYFVTPIGFVFIAISCTINPPDINVTTDKTALENQLFGENWEMDNDPLNTAAVWSAFSADNYLNAAADTADNKDYLINRRVIMAQIRRRSLQPYLDDLKSAGVIGENNIGIVEFRSDTAEISNDLRNLINAENEDRAIIWETYAVINNIDSESGKQAMRKNFAEIAIKLSPSGTWIQDYSGNWMRK